jgi:hypothetical protein
MVILSLLKFPYSCGDHPAVEDRDQPIFTHQRLSSAVEDQKFEEKMSFRSRLDSYSL